MSNPTLPCNGVPAAQAASRRRRSVTRALVTALGLVLPAATLAQTDLSTVPLPTYTVGTTVDIKPNILMVLDDSGSMMWNWLPDWGGLSNQLGYSANYKSYQTMFQYWDVSAPPYLFANAGFNGIAYNPAVTYLPPVTFNSSGAKDTTTYPSMDGTSAATGADTSKGLPNWRMVPSDGFGVQSTARTNLQQTPAGDFYTVTNVGAYYYTVLPGEYCDSPALTNCTATTTATGSYQYPAYVRWCNSAALTSCKALPDGNYTFPRVAAPRVSSIAFSGASGAVVSGITVDGLQIMSAATSSSSSNGNLASLVAAAINNCTYGKTGNCTTAGYIANASGSTVRIYAPGVTSSTPSVTRSGVSYAASAFARAVIPLPDYLSGSSQSSAAVPGENVRVTITPAVDSYPYPGSTSKAPTRTDCAGTTCTYDEEMTNYANWWAYYHTRMQMMKSATARAFSTLDTDADIAAGTTRYRVGYLTLNNNAGSDFVNISDFTGSQKFTWYSKFLSARPNNGTPLRPTLADAGRLYAGMLDGTNYNNVAVTDPVQFSCQRNYTILSTDGYWNGAAGYKLDGSTNVGNQDGLLPRPYNDGASQQIQASTSQLEQRTVTQTAQKGTLQKQVSQLKAQTSQLQTQTSQLQRSTNGGPWTGVSSCKANKTTQCQTVVTSIWTNTSSCTATTAPDSNGYTTQCRYTGWSSPASVGSCTPVAQSSGPNYKVGVATQCSTVVSSSYANAGSCTPTTTPDANGQTVQCRYAFATAAATSTCSPAYVANDFTNATVYQNCNANGVVGNWTNVSSCTATSTPDANGNTTECQYTGWTGWSTVSSCSALPQSTSPNYTVGTARQCQTIATGGTSNTLADVAAYYYNTDLRSPTATGADATGTCTGPIISPATTAQDLCENNVVPYGRDTATWQHMTLHTLGLGAQGMMVYSQYQNNAAGQRVPAPDYWTQPSGDFYSVANGSTAAPASGICPWMTNGSTCTWPTPASDSIANIDDLWHAAVNGHGSYFSATDPSSLAGALSGVLSQVANPPRPGTAAAAASSNPNITSSDNYVFSSSYRSVDWYGELIMQQFNTDGTIGAQQWSAMQQLDCDSTPWAANTTYTPGQVFSQGGHCFVVNTGYTSGASFAGGSGPDGGSTTQLAATPAARNVYTVGATGLVQFQWGNLSTTQQSYFSMPYINYVSSTQGLSQFCSTGGTCLSSTAQASAAGQALVNFLRGERSNEGTYFRSRVHVLGDIVNSEARYVKQPLQQYADSGYAAFAAAQKDRPPTVYVGANDGMLHAFNALTGQERWAFIPSAVLPNLYRLADMNYANQHAYLVDGTPEVGDICPSAPASTCGASDWKTIIVGGLNEGGKSYYALDITDPGNPRLLWEFTDTNLGLTYSNPRITKLANGTWVVIVASGYNNADGLGHLYVLNAATGAKLNDIATTAGTASAPSGLSKIAARAPSGATNNTVEEVYGGDLLGNVWRFDVNDTIGKSGTDAQLLIQLQDPGGNPQPITTKPVVASVNNLPLVIVGTGKYLGLGDLTTTQVQSMYGIKDPLTSATLTTPRASGSNFVQQTLTTTKCPNGTASTICSSGQDVITASTNPVDWGTKNGWYLDFINSGERSVTDASLALGTLVFTTIKPQSPGGNNVVGCTGTDAAINAQSFLYYLDYQSGGPVSGTNNVVGSQLCTCVATRPSVVKTESGTVEGIIRMSGGGQSSGTDMGVTARQDLPINQGGGVLRRISWRELNGQ